MYRSLNLGSRDEPESEAENPFTCSRCGEDFDLDDDPHTDDEEGYICEECQYHCSACGKPCGDYQSEECREDGGDRVCLDCFAFSGPGED